MEKGKRLIEFRAGRGARWLRVSTLGTPRGGVRPETGGQLGRGAPGRFVCVLRVYVKGEQLCVRGSAKPCHVTQGEGQAKSRFGGARQLLSLKLAGGGRAAPRCRRGARRERARRHRYIQSVHEPPRGGVLGVTCRVALGTPRASE